MKAKSLPSLTPFRLDSANQTLWRGSQAIPLTPKAFTVLHYLMARPGQLVTKEELLNAAWPGIYVSDAALKVCIRRLRQALGDLSHPPQYIETMHWRGYRFIGKIDLSDPSLPADRGQNPEGRGQKQSSVQSLGSRVQEQDSEPAPNPQPLVPTLVGREAELAQLHGWLEKALRGERQVVFVTGESGIGKTTVVEAFLARAETQVNIWTARGRCVAHYGTGEAYLPVLEALERLCRTPGHERFAALLSRHAPMWMAQMPALLNPAERKRLRRELQGATRA